MRVWSSSPNFLRRFAITLLFLSIVCKSSAFADTPTLRMSTEGEGAFYSRYEFRGLTRYSGLAFQPSGKVHYPLSKSSELLGEARLQVPMQGERDGSEISEAILSGMYKISPGAGEAVVGGTWYTYGDDAPPSGTTGEVFGILAFNAVLNPSFSLFQNIETRARYFEIGLSEQLGTDYYDRDLIFIPFARLGFGFKTDKDVYGSSGYNHTDLGVEADYNVATSILYVMVGHTERGDTRVDNANWVGAGIRFKIS